MSQIPVTETTTSGSAALRIDLYADIACPWCYIGERRLARALAARPNLHIERHWQPFQLQPDLPPGGIPWSDLIERKFGGAASAAEMFGRVAAAGAPDGIAFNFDRVTRAPNTADAHRLVLFAAEQGQTWTMVETLFAAYFTDGRDVSDREELIALAAAAGLDAAAARDYLASDANVAAVQASQRTAYRHGVQGVPFFVFAERYALSGAQPLDIFERALDLASSEGEENAG
ncbi:MAG: DsbA family oxidoreductase [Thermomicrobiales bacterium]